MLEKQARRLSVLLVVLGAVLCGEARASHVVPTAIEFTILHGDCNIPANGSFSFYVNGHLLGSAATTYRTCDCEARPSVYTFRDAAALALFDPDACNHFEVVVSGADLIALAYVQVGVVAAEPVPALCLYDAGPGACEERNLCDAYAYGVSAVGQADADGDGVAEGFGDGCDDCPRVANPGQADGDADGFGDACDSCPGPGTVDSDLDGACDEHDNCPSLPSPDQTDYDQDGVGNACDNCLFNFNPNQHDSDLDGFGDACDYCFGPGQYDYDADGFCVDNCPFYPNSDQADGDLDGVGDACDNCPTTPNADQQDLDYNGIGDACQPCPVYGDIDNDRVCNGVDNCLYYPNPDQADADGDGFGDVCDFCSGPGDNDYDADGVCTGADNCPNVPNPDQADTDGDGFGNACDFCSGVGTYDSDHDTVCDQVDNCPGAPNPDQADTDGDGYGNACDPCAGPGLDQDGDGLCDNMDNCPFLPNLAQADRDGDGSGDACDSCPAVSNPGQQDQDSNGVGDACQACALYYDPDGDGVCDPGDNCYYLWNPDQSDRDGDGIGDACDDDCGALIGNGTLRLGVQCYGNLNFYDPQDTRFGYVGLRYVPTGNASLEPGSPCEGWGAADRLSGITGFADLCDGGPRQLYLVQFSATATNAISVVDVRDTYRVTHEYRPSPDSPYLYEVLVTIENIAPVPTRLAYRRVMDWDIEPTPFHEFVTLFEGTLGGRLHTASDAFAGANPWSAAIGSPGPVTDRGPGDLGALFDLDLGTLAPGERRTFRSYYGAAGSERDILDALLAVHAEAFTLGEPNTMGGPDLGIPNTFAYALAGIGGGRYCESSGQCNDGSSCTADVCETATHTCRIQPDADQDGTPDACDPCPLDPHNDADHDGVCGDVDACPSSIVSPTVVLGSCDTRVPNAHLPSALEICFSNRDDADFVYEAHGRSCAHPVRIGGRGCTVSDDLEICHHLANSNRKWKECVERLTKEMKQQHLLTEKQRNKIRKCLDRLLHGGRGPHSHSRTRHVDENRP